MKKWVGWTKLVHRSAHWPDRITGLIAYQVLSMPEWMFENGFSIWMVRSSDRSLHSLSSHWWIRSTSRFRSPLLPRTLQILQNRKRINTNRHSSRRWNHAIFRSFSLADSNGVVGFSRRCCFVTEYCFFFPIYLLMFFFCF